MSRRGAKAAAEADDPRPGVVEIDLRDLEQVTVLASGHFHWKWPRPVRDRYLDLQDRICAHWRGEGPLRLNVSQEGIDDVTILAAWCLFYWHYLGPRLSGGRWSRETLPMNQILLRLMAATEIDGARLYELLCLGRPDDSGAEQRLRLVVYPSALPLPFDIWLVPELEFRGDY